MSSVHGLMIFGSEVQGLFTVPRFAPNRARSREPEAIKFRRGQLRNCLFNDKCRRDTVRKKRHTYTCTYLDHLRVCSQREGLFKGKAPKRNKQLLAISSMMIGGVETVSPEAFSIALRSEYDAKYEFGI